MYSSSSKEASIPDQSSGVLSNFFPQLSNRTSFLFRECKYFIPRKLLFINGLFFAGDALQDRKTAWASKKLP